jgi:hypothetical protein
MPQKMMTEKRQQRGQTGKAARHASPTSLLSGASASPEANVSKPRLDSPTATGETSLTAHEAMLALTEIFSNLPNRNNTNRRTYVLELEGGEPVFRRDEFCLAFDSALNEVFGPKADNDGDDIVPQKLSKLFPGRRRSHDV